ncbi:MAG TPA: sensor histidine kinase [Bacteroidetes bacterium]|nr:sensor histidine kinase [Bacteroidota bacterium]
MHASTIYENMGDHKTALDYYKKFKTAQDSLVSVEKDATMSELLTKYETEKKEALIASQKEVIGQQKTIQWGAIAFAAILSFFMVLLYRNYKSKQKTNALLKTTNNELEKRNSENELLLKEIHHRVKNNLETVSSLLALQSAHVQDPTVLDAMQESQNRVQSMGIIHQKLYQGKNLAAIEMKDYFINLSENILDSFGAENRINVECAMDALELDVDTAVPVGLIVNELLTNALKYAFPENIEGQIKISLKEIEKGKLELKIADNGVGKNILENKKPTGFGTQLVQLLTTQLGGKLEEINKGGTIISMQFKNSMAA